MPNNKALINLLKNHEEELLSLWITEQKNNSMLKTELMPEADIRQQSAEFLSELIKALASAQFSTDIKLSSWDTLRNNLEKTVKARTRFGLSHVETSLFILSLKNPLAQLAAKEPGMTTEPLLALIQEINIILDNLALSIVEIYIKNREEIIKRQQEEMMELSTPVVKLWDKVLTLPLIGTLDSARTQVVMESLLQAIVETQSTVAIIDITGVPTVDTLVAQHLMKTVAAARLMGADCIISGIRPQIAQSMVHLGVSFNDIITKATLADAIRYAFSLIGIRMVRDDKK
uniref:STAS domain-containing protein n=1 Tax=Gracilinema caldarium TaxID=215591 RepID=A0A7C3EA85_9SPIR